MEVNPVLYMGISPRESKLPTLPFQSQTKKETRGLIVESILVCTSASQTPALGVVDWETCHYGPRLHDLGHFIAHVSVAGRMNGDDTCNGMVRGVIDGYGYDSLSEDLAFHVAVLVGISYFSWDYVLHGSNYTPELAEDAVRFAADLVINGREKNRSWFERTALGFMFDHVRVE